MTQVFNIFRTPIRRWYIWTFKYLNRNFTPLWSLNSMYTMRVVQNWLHKLFFSMSWVSDEAFELSNKIWCKLYVPLDIQLRWFSLIAKSTRNKPHLHGTSVAQTYTAPYRDSHHSHSQLPTTGADLLSFLWTITETFESLLFDEFSCLLHNTNFIWVAWNTDSTINNLVLHFSWRTTNRLLYFLVCVAILVHNLEKEYEERHWLTDHLRTKMKYRALKNKCRTLTMGMYFYL
jgi:hypothetical protein